MKLKFFPALLTLSFIALSSIATAQQNKDDNKQPANKIENKTETKSANVNKPTVNITPTTAPTDLAKVAVDVLGGEKYKGIKSLVLKGSVNITLPNSTQTIPGTFVIATSGDKYRLEVQSLRSFTQIYDGQEFYSSLQGVELPPPTKVGLNSLQHLGEKDYTIQSITDKNKMRGFSLTTPEGYTTRFYLDQNTGRIKLYEVPHNEYTFSSEIDEFKEYEGVLVPVKFYQRLDFSFGTVYTEYKTKDAQVNQAIEDNVFRIPSR